MAHDGRWIVERLIVVGGGGGVVAMVMVLVNNSYGSSAHVADARNAQNLGVCNIADSIAGSNLHNVVCAVDDGRRVERQGQRQEERNGQACQEAQIATNCNRYKRDRSIEAATNTNEQRCSCCNAA
jgi:hypothetical protein